MYKQALISTKSFFPQDQIVEFGLEIIFQDTISLKEVNDLKRIATKTHSMFYPITQQSTILIFGTSHSWVGEQARQRNLVINSVQFPCGGDGRWDAYCANNNYGLIIYSGRYADAKLRLREDLDLVSGNYGVVAHEYFHTVQFALAKKEAFDPASNFYIPVWLKEGSANFYGFAALDDLGIHSYGASRFTEVESHPSYSQIESKVPLEKYATYSSSNQGVSLNSYGIGMAATEFIVASVGFKSLLDIFKFTKDSNNFAESFQRAVGIPLERFYQLFEAARPSLKIGKNSI
jgi:hypothetical protein